jgi:hypothetical protein
MSRLSKLYDAMQTLRNEGLALEDIENHVRLLPRSISLIKSEKNYEKMASSLVTYSTSYWGKEETKNISPNLLRVILFLICCTTAFSIDFVYKLWSE